MFAPPPFDDEEIEECSRLVRVCAEIFSGPNLSEHGMAVYLNAIRCSDADKVIEALKSWLYNDDSFPAPASIRLRIHDMDAWEKEMEREAYEANKRYNEFIARETAKPAETELTAADIGRD